MCKGFKIYFLLFLCEIGSSVYVGDEEFRVRSDLRNILHVSSLCIKLTAMSIIVILFNHPKVNAQNINDFLQMGLALRTLEEKSKFLLQLLSLPNDIRNFSSKIKRTGVKSEGKQDDEHVDEEFFKHS